MPEASGEAHQPSMPTPEEVREAIRVVEDPEIRISIVDLGLVYGIECADGKVSVAMTLTTPFCPLGPMMMSQVEEIARAMPGVKEAKVELVWTPPWDPKTMASEQAKDQLGLW